MEEKLRVAALNMARDICLKMIERRSLSPEQLPGALSLLSVAAQNLMSADKGGMLTVRLAREFCLKALERNHISGAQAAAAYLAECVKMIEAATQKIDAEKAGEAMTAAKDLVLKMLETGRINSSQIPELFEALVVAASV